MQCFLRKNECLSIGSVMINVLDVQLDCVKLGITDPDAFPAYREEVLYLSSDDDDSDGPHECEEVGTVFEPISLEAYRTFSVHVL